MSNYAFMWAKRQCVGDSTTKTVLKTYANWASEDYSTWVTNEEMLIDTELNIQTIRKARAKLIELGYLIETEKRIGETRSIVVYQMVAPPGSIIVQAIDQRTGETISLSPPSREEYEKKPLQKRSPSKNRPSSAKSAKGDEKPSPSKIGAPPNSTSSPSKSHAKGGEIPLQVPPNFIPNKADIALESRSSSDAREDDAVDNSAAAAAAEDDQKAGTTPLDVEARLTDLLIGLEAERGKQLVIDRSADRLHIVTWVGRELTEAELRIAHARAAGARQRDKDNRALNVAFVACFVDEVLAERDIDAQIAAGDAPPGDWWLSDSGIGRQGKHVHVERRPNEHTPDYLVRVAQASGRGPWIDYVLKREQGSSRYREIVEFFGDALMPTDHYAS